MSSSAQRRIKVFFSYAHEDEPLVDECRAQLSLFDRLKLIREWHDRQVPPGGDWKGFIDRHLFSSDIVVLFVSPDFFTSDYCYDVEMTEALKRHDDGSARVVPVILRPCAWQSAPFSRLQVLPRDGLPVTKWPNRDEACLDVAQGIMRVVEQASRAGAADPASDSSEAGKGTPASAAVRPADTGSLPPELQHVQCDSPLCRSPDVQLSEPPVLISSVEQAADGGWIARGRVQVEYSITGHCLTCGRLFEVARRAIPMQFADLPCTECGEHTHLEYRPTGFQKVDGGYEFGVEIRCSECKGTRTVSRVLRSLLRTVGIDIGRSGIKVTQAAG